MWDRGLLCSDLSSPFPLIISSNRYNPTQDKVASIFNFQFWQNWCKLSRMIKPFEMICLYKFTNVDLRKMFWNPRAPLLVTLCSFKLNPGLFLLLWCESTQTQSGYYPWWNMSDCFITFACLLWFQQYHVLYQRTLLLIYFWLQAKILT